VPISNWWLVDDVSKLILGGPFLWDGVTQWDVPSGQRAVPNDPSMTGYAWPSSPTLPSNGTSMADVVARLTALESRATALEARLYREARGVAVIPAITNVLGATINVPVQFRTPVRTSAGVTTVNYTVTPLLMPGTLLGSLSIPSAPTIVDAQNVTVPVKSTGLVTLGQATVLVFADANS
jgi:hypothetical protein